MTKKLPKIYKGNDFSHVNNNKQVFYSSKEEIKKDLNKDILIFDKQYILNTPVVIETIDNNIYNTKIISKVSDHILISNNKIIKLEQIKSIKTLIL